MPFRNNTAPCPYCYVEIQPAKLSYRCSGRPAPGRSACRPREDANRIRALGNAEPVLPSFHPNGRTKAGAVCPACAGPTGTRVCPNCHSVLPDNFTEDSPLFGIAGVRGSGKTVMLTVLGAELTQTVARRFDANIDTVGASKILTRLATDRQQMERGTGELPAQTEVADRVPAVYSITMRKTGVVGIKQTISTIFSFYDTAGENLATADRARDLHYLEATDGIILLLDPFGFRANRDEALDRGVDPGSLAEEPSTVVRALTDVLREAERLKPNKKIKRPVAIVLAKADAFYDQLHPDSPARKPSSTEPVFNERESLEVHEHVGSLINNWGGDDVLRQFEHQYENYRFFAASALGSEPNYRTRIVNSRGIQPHRVAEPLLWLMSRKSLIAKNA